MNPPKTLPMRLTILAPLITDIIPVIKLRIPQITANITANFNGSTESMTVNPFSELKFKIIPLPLFAMIL